MRASGQSLQDIANEFCLSRERVRQILAKYGDFRISKDTVEFGAVIALKNFLKDEGYIISRIAEKSGEKYHTFKNQLVGSSSMKKDTFNRICEIIRVSPDKFLGQQ